MYILTDIFAVFGETGTPFCLVNMTSYLITLAIGFGGGYLMVIMDDYAILSVIAP